MFKPSTNYSGYVCLNECNLVLAKSMYTLMYVKILIAIWKIYLLRFCQTKVDATCFETSSDNDRLCDTYDQVLSIYDYILIFSDLDIITECNFYTDLMMRKTTNKLLPRLVT